MQNDYKVQLYKVVTNCYAKLPDPLIAGRMFDVFLEIFTTLVEQEKLHVASEALQLSVLLLPTHQREQLKRLFDFMNVVSHDQWIKLSKQVIINSGNWSFSSKS